METVSTNHTIPINYQLTRPGAFDPTLFDDESPGMDLYSPFDVSIQPGEQKKICTGVVFEFPPFKYGILMSKSSVATRKQLNVEAGVIDRGYRGEIGVVLRNMSKDVVVIKRGEAIAQMLLQDIKQPILNRVDKIDINTNRGTRGFGGYGTFTDVSLGNSCDDK